MELTTSLNDTSVEAPDDDAILRAILSIVDGDLDGEQVFLGHGPDDDEQILSVAAYYEGTGWILFVGRRGRDGAADETYRTADAPLPTSRAVEVLQQHSKGDNSWQCEFRWKPFQPVEISIKTLKSLGILAACRPVRAGHPSSVHLLNLHHPRTRPATDRRRADSAKGVACVRNSSRVGRFKNRPIARNRSSTLMPPLLGGFGCWIAVQSGQADSRWFPCPKNGR